MTTFARIINYLFIISFILKSIFHYLHVRQTDAGNLKNIFKYLYVIPVLDKQDSKYKIWANIFAILSIITIIIFLSINMKNIVLILKQWKNIP